MIGFGFPKSPPRAQKPPVLVRIQYPGAEVVVEVPAIHGDSAGVAARLRREGLAAVKRGAEVIVNGSAEFRK